MKIALALALSALLYVGTSTLIAAAWHEADQPADQQQQQQQLRALVLSKLLAERQQQRQESRYLGERKRYFNLPTDVSERTSDVSSLEEEEEEAAAATQRREQKKRELAKKRWHKLVDDLIDNLEGSSATKGAADKRSKQHKQKLAGTLNEEKMMILMKRPPQDGDEDGNGNGANGLSLLLQQQRADELPRQSRQQQAADAPGGHARRVLDDKFGIVRESIFTTNNHLGQKGVPKFGSEEEY